MADPSLGSFYARDAENRPLFEEGSKAVSQDSEGYHSSSQASDVPSAASKDLLQEGNKSPAKPPPAAPIDVHSTSVDQNGHHIRTVAAAASIASLSGPSSHAEAPVSYISSVPVQGSQSTSSLPPGSLDTQKRLHVSNLPFRFRDGDLLRLFEPHGQVAEAEIIFNERGSKGFGFVTFDTNDEADRAKMKVHGSIIDGRKIEVNDATPRTGPKKPKVYPQPGLAAASYRGYPAIGRGYGPAGYPGGALQRPMYDPRSYGGAYPDMTQASYYSAYPGYGTQDAYQSGYTHQDYAAQYAQAYLGQTQAASQNAQQSGQQQQAQTGQQQQQQQQQKTQPGQQTTQTGTERQAYSSTTSSYGPVHGYQQHNRYQPY